MLKKEIIESNINEEVANGTMEILEQNLHSILVWDDENNKETDAEAEKANEGPLKRMWNVLVQMWQAIISIFKNR